MKTIVYTSVLLMLIFACFGCNKSESNPTNPASSIERNIVKTRTFFIVGQMIGSGAYQVRFEQNHTVKFYVEATMSPLDGDYLGGGTWSVQGVNITFDYTSIRSGHTERYTGTVNVQGTCMQGTVRLDSGVVVNWWNTMVSDCGR